MYDLENKRERRTYKRLLARRGAVALVETLVNKLGQVEDISFGGLSFCYMQLEKETSVSGGVDLFFPRYDFFMKQIPMRVVTDIEELNQSPFRTVTMRRCGVQFLELSDEHRLQLEFFLRNYTVTDQNHPGKRKPEK